MHGATALTGSHSALSSGRRRRTPVSSWVWPASAADCGRRRDAVRGRRSAWDRDAGASRGGKSGGHVLTVYGGMGVVRRCGSGARRRRLAATSSHAGAVWRFGAPLREELCDRRRAPAVERRRHTACLRFTPTSALVRRDSRVLLAPPWCQQMRVGAGRRGFTLTPHLPRGRFFRTLPVIVDRVVRVERRSPRRCWCGSVSEPCGPGPNWWPIVVLAVVRRVEILAVIRNHALWNR